jgi:hypothetical protein
MNPQLHRVGMAKVKILLETSLFLPYFDFASSLTHDRKSRLDL